MMKPEAVAAGVVTISKDSVIVTSGQGSDGCFGGGLTSAG